MLEEDRERIHHEAQKQTKYMDLSVVRLMFTPYLPGSDGKFTHRLSSVISGPIYDSSEYIFHGLYYGQNEVMFLCLK